MQHQRYVIWDLSISGRSIRGQGGDLVVARRPESTDLDWELIYRTGEWTPIEQSPYRLRMGGPQGEKAGPAILVRSDGLSHVFRGAGDLEGFDEAEFARSG